MITPSTPIIMKFIFFLLTIFSINTLVAQDHYKTDSGLTFYVGDSIKIGQPLSHLGWRSIYRERGEDYIKNKNLITKVVTITAIDTLNKPVNFSINYKNRIFKVDIDEALRNKEIIPKLGLAPLEISKYDQLLKLKDLLDKGILTQKEFDAEKKKILNEK